MTEARITIGVQKKAVTIFAKMAFQLKFISAFDPEVRVCVTLEPRSVTLSCISHTIISVSCKFRSKDTIISETA
jgi:hypothetical protein